MGQMTPNGVTEQTNRVQEQNPDIALDALPQDFLGDVTDFFTSLDNAAQDDPAAAEAVNAFIQEIQQTTGLYTNDPDMQVQASSGMEQLNSAIQDSNMPEEIISSFNNIYTASIDSPHYLNVLNGFIQQGGNSISGIAGAAQRLDAERIAKRNDADNRASAAGTAAMIQNANNSLFDPEVIDAVAAKIWDNASEDFRDRIRAASERMYAPDAPPEQIAAALDDATEAMSTEVATSPDSTAREALTDMEASEDKANYVIELTIESTIDVEIHKRNREAQMSPDEEAAQRIALREQIAPAIEDLRNDPERMAALIARVDRDQALSNNNESYINTNFLRLGLAAYTAVSGEVPEGLESFNSVEFYQKQRDSVQENLSEARQELENLEQWSRSEGYNGDMLSSYALYQARDQVVTGELNLEVIDLQEQTENFITEQITASGQPLTPESLREILLNVDPALFAQSAELARRTGNDEYDPSSILAAMTQEFSNDQKAEFNSIMGFTGELSAAKIEYHEAREWREQEAERMRITAENDPDGLGLQNNHNFGAGMGIVSAIAPTDGSYMGSAMEAERSALENLARIRLGLDENATLPEFAMEQEAVLQSLSRETSVDQSEIQSTVAEMGFYGEHLDNAVAHISASLANNYNIAVSGDITQELTGFEYELSAEMSLEEQIETAFTQNGGTLTQQDIELIISEAGIDGAEFQVTLDEMIARYSNHEDFSIEPPVASAAAQYAPDAAEVAINQPIPSATPQPNEPEPEDQQYGHNGGVQSPSMIG